jgi:hypothetical protein
VAWRWLHIGRLRKFVWARAEGKSTMRFLRCCLGNPSGTGTAPLEMSSQDSILMAQTTNLSRWRQRTWLLPRAVASPHPEIEQPCAAPQIASAVLTLTPTTVAGAHDAAGVLHVRVCARGLLHQTQGERAAARRRRRRRARRTHARDAGKRFIRVTLRARWVTLRARWVTLRARWVTLRARWVTLRARWVRL